MMHLKGCFTAIVTPFRNGKVDFPALRRIVRFQADSGVAGIVPCGSTGEAATLSEEEYLAVIRTAVREAKGKIPVMPGVGTNSTAKSVAMAKKAAGAGADALLAIVPYYNKPTQEGMKQHFSAIVKSSRLPVVLYNIPGRTGVNMLPSTVLSLRSRFRSIIGVKEASGNLDQVSEIVNGADSGFSVMSGDDSLTLPMMSVGASGVISVISNILPVETARMCSLFHEGDTAGAAAIHHRLFPLGKALFRETNPIPVKFAASLLGLCGPEMRLPLTVLSAANRGLLKKALKKAGAVRARR